MFHVVTSSSFAPRISRSVLRASRPTAATTSTQQQIFERPGRLAPDLSGLASTSSSSSSSDIGPIGLIGLIAVLWRERMSFM